MAGSKCLTPLGWIEDLLLVPNYIIYYLYWLTSNTGFSSVFLAIKLGVYYLFFKYFMDPAVFGIS